MHVSQSWIYGKQDDAKIHEVVIIKENAIRQPSYSQYPIIQSAQIQILRATVMVGLKIL